MTVVKIIISDPAIIDRWIRFSEALKLSSVTIAELRLQHLSYQPSFENLFREILLKWMSRNPEGRKVAILTKILDEIEFKYIAGCWFEI